MYIGMLLSWFSQAQYHLAMSTQIEKQYLSAPPTFPLCSFLISVHTPGLTSIMTFAPRMSLTYIYTLYRWNYTGCILSCLASLAQCSIYEIHTDYCLYVLDAHSPCCLVFPCIAQFVHQLLVGSWFFVLGLVPPEYQYHDHSSPSRLVMGVHIALGCLWGQGWKCSVLVYECIQI